MNCKHCNEPIGKTPGWRGEFDYIHHPDDGMDAYSFCRCKCVACMAYEQIDGQKSYDEVMQSTPCICVDGEEAEAE